jgi:hypothetical protein
VYTSPVQSAPTIDGHIWRSKMRTSKVCRVNVNLTEGVLNLAYRAITGGRYSSVSEYVRALIVTERRRSGDPEWSKVNPRVPMGRPKAA